MTKIRADPSMLIDACNADDAPEIFEDAHRFQKTRTMQASDSQSSLASTSSSKSRSRGRSESTVMDVTSLREQFDLFDKDGSGFLEREECIAALAKLGSKMAFEDLDKDGDQRISFEEFTVVTQLAGTHSHAIFKSAQQHAGRNPTGISAFAGEAHLHQAFMESAAKAWQRATPHLRSKGEAAMRAAFATFDNDKSGEMDHGELRKVIKDLAPQLTEVDVQLMLACADVNRDGKISEKEFVTVMLYDHEAGAPYWERNAKRDMMAASGDRRGTIRY